MTVKNKFSLGDSVEMMTPNGNIQFTLDALQNAKGESIDVAPGNGHIVYLPVPVPVPVPMPDDVALEFALLLRNLPSDVTTRNPNAV